MEVSFYELDSIKDIKVAPNRNLIAEFMPIFAEHNSVKKKAIKKLPTWVENKCIFAVRPFEQSTSEEISEYRSAKFSGLTILSLTGGLGVDDIAFEKNGNTVTSLDPDACLNALFDFNAKKLGVSRVNRITITAEEFLAQNATPYHLVFIDPDRRATSKRATSNIADYSPNIFTLFETYQQVAPIWVIKLSPMTDINWLHNQFHQKIDIEVLGSPSEVKEIMVTISSKSTGSNKYVALENGMVHNWDGISPIETKKPEGLVFFEPAPGLLKCNFHHVLESQFKLKAVNKYHTFFLGETLLPRWMGRSFKWIETAEGSLGEIGGRIRKLGISQANITARDFVLDADETRKQLKLKDGGDYYLFFTGKKNKTCFICCKN